MRSVSFATLLERTWSGITGMVRKPSTPAALFRQADRYRNEGRYDEAARLVAQGLRQAPDSHVGRLLSAYLYVAARRELVRVPWHQTLGSCKHVFGGLGKTFPARPLSSTTHRFELGQ